MENREEVASNPCGGCGEKDSSKRCMGCLHDFGTPESAWVQTVYVPTKETPHGE